MNRILPLLIFLITTLHLFGQKPEPIYSFAVVHKPLAWYKEQQTAWKKEVDKDPKNAIAWYYYYRVNRNLFFNDTTDTRTRQQKREGITRLIEEMGKNIPGTYEYLYCQFAHDGLGGDYVPRLEKLMTLGEGRTEHLDYVAIWGELERDMKKRHEYALKMYEAGLISPGMAYYNHNVMVGTKPNAILLTEGDNDTYPAWALQAKGIRTDVTVINLSLLGIDAYREKIFKELAIDAWKNGNDSNHDQYEQEIVKHIAANKKNYPVYVALTVKPAYTETVQENLYLTGLAYQYSATPVDNIAALKRNFEQQYTLDYIDKAFFADMSEDRVGAASCNYIVPMLKLYDHYKEAGDTQKMEWIKSKVLFITKGKTQEKEVRKHLEQ